MSISPRLSKKNLLSESLAPESLMAMKALNVTVDSGMELPADVSRKDIGVRVIVCLENKDSEKPKRDQAATKRAEEIQQYAESILTKAYTGDPEDAKYLLKVYVVLAMERSILNRLTLGTIGQPKTECLEWFLEKTDVGGAEICKAGRIGSQNRGQILAMTEELCEQLIQKIAVPASD